MRMKSLPVATVATQTDACSNNGSYWDLLSITSLVSSDDDDADSVVGLSDDEDVLEPCPLTSTPAAESQTQLSIIADLSICHRLSSACLRDDVDDDGYDVIVDDSDTDSCYRPLFEDYFVKLDARDRREQHAELTPFAQGDIVAGSKLTNIIKLQSSRDQQVPPPVMPAVCTAHRSETVSDLCDQCRQRGFGEPSVSQAMRAVPRMGTRLGPRPVRTASVDTCTCQLDRLRGVCDAEWRWPVGRTSLSDSEKSVGTTTLTDVKFRRTWSSDGDAPAVAVGGSSSSSSSSGPLASEMCANDNACLGTTEAERQSGSSLHGGSSTAARRMAYEQFAHVMYTNRANLQHTIAVQQRLFQQQLSDRALTDHALRGYINASPLGPPPLPPRKTHAEQQRGRGERSDGQQLHEWVVRRRADGTRYITRRTASPRHNSRQLTSSSSQEHQHRQALSGKTDVGRRKEAKDAGTEAPERTKKHDRPVNGKSAPTFPVMPSLRQAHQHPILAVITI